MSLSSQSGQRPISLGSHTVYNWFSSEIPTSTKIVLDLVNGKPFLVGVDCA